MTAPGQPTDPDEYPQAIADDYPGWGIAWEDGHWSAWCPAVSIQSRTAGELRAAIERAINPGDQD